MQTEEDARDETTAAVKSMMAKTPIGRWWHGMHGWGIVNVRPRSSESCL